MSAGTPPSACRRFVVSASLWALACSPVFAATPLLRCMVDQGGVVRVLESTPVGDPYSVAAVDINGRFRFKAVVVGTAQAVEYVKLYVYESRSRQPVLLHQATHRAPVPLAAPQEAALTGLQVVYASALERELRYACALHGDTSP